MHSDLETDKVSSELNCEIHHIPPFLHLPWAQNLHSTIVTCCWFPPGVANGKVCSVDFYKVMDKEERARFINVF